MNNISPNGGWDWSKRRYVPATETQIDKLSLVSGDVLFNCTNSPAMVGKSAYFTGADERVLFSNHFYRIRVSESKLDPSYLTRSLRWHFERGTFRSMCNAWVNQATVRRDDLQKLKVPLPPLPEQRRIAAILDKADALRAKRREAIAKLDQLLQSVFLDMFGDPVTNPKGWPTARAGEVFSEFVGGKNVACPDESGSPYRILKVSAVTRKTYLPHESKPAPSDFSPPASTLVQAGDLLFSRANTSELVAATAYVWSTPKNMVLPDKLWKLILGSNQDVDVMYIWELFKNESFRRDLAKTASGTSGSMKNISKSKLRQVTLLMPPFEIQEKFGKICRTIHAQIKLLADAEAKAEKTFVSLQQRAFSGQLSEAA